MTESVTHPAPLIASQKGARRRGVRAQRHYDIIGGLVVRAQMKLLHGHDCFMMIVILKITKSVLNRLC